MSVSGTIAVTCPACGQTTDCKLYQSINARTEPSLKAQLLAGDLNVLDCVCGRRTQLAATLLFHDPDTDFYGQVVPGGEPEMVTAAALFKASGATGTQRLVPSPNALIEKVKLVDAGLADWAIEMAKVLLLASLPGADLDRVMLFDHVDNETIHWILYDGAHPEPAASARTAYARLDSRDASKPASTEYRIDRAWAVAAVQALIADQN